MNCSEKMYSGDNKHREFVYENEGNEKRQKSYKEDWDDGAIKSEKNIFDVNLHIVHVMLTDKDPLCMPNKRFFGNNDRLDSIYNYHENFEKARCNSSKSFKNETRPISFVLSFKTDCVCVRGSIPVF